MAIHRDFRPATWLERQTGSDKMVMGMDVSGKHLVLAALKLQALRDNWSSRLKWLYGSATTFDRALASLVTAQTIPGAVVRLPGRSGWIGGFGVGAALSDQLRGSPYSHGLETHQWPSRQEYMAALAMRDSNLVQVPEHPGLLIPTTTPNVAAAAA